MLFSFGAMCVFAMLACSRDGCLGIWQFLSVGYVVHLMSLRGQVSVTEIESNFEVKGDSGRPEGV